MNPFLILLINVHSCAKTLELISYLLMAILGVMILPYIVRLAKFIDARIRSWWRRSKGEREYQSSYLDFPW